MRVALLHCTAPPLVLSCRWLTCPVLVSVHVHELWVCNGFDEALCIRSAFQISHDALHVHFVALGQTNDLSCCLLHAVHDVCSFLAHVQTFFHGCSVHCSSIVHPLQPAILSSVLSGHSESPQVLRLRGQEQ